jgi:cytochrome c nitrite reductase small subunit
VARYWNKAENGLWHSVGFTTGNFPEPLQITPGNARVTEQACRPPRAALLQHRHRHLRLGGDQPQGACASG